MPDNRTRDPERLRDDLAIVPGMFGPKKERAGDIRDAERAEIALLAPVDLSLSPNDERPAKAPVERQNTRRHLDEERRDPLPHAVPPHLDDKMPEKKTLATESRMEGQHSDMGAVIVPGGSQARTHLRP